MSAPEPGTTSPELAPWISRVGAAIIDALPTIVVNVIVFVFWGHTTTTTSTTTSDGSVTSTGTSHGVSVTGLPALLLFVLVVAWFAYNWIYLQGSTGQTIGKRLVGISVGGPDGRPIGGGLTFARQLAHVLDAIPCFIGFLWPLWDGENRTFADMITSTRVRRA